MSWKVLIQDFKLQDPDSFNSVTIALKNLSCASLSDQSHSTHTRTHILGWGWEKNPEHRVKNTTQNDCANYYKGK